MIEEEKIRAENFGRWMLIGSLLKNMEVDLFVVADKRNSMIRTKKTSTREALEIRNLLIKTHKNLSTLKNLMEEEMLWDFSWDEIQKKGLEPSSIFYGTGKLYELRRGDL